jgi:outer membrane protein TolC
LNRNKAQKGASSVNAGALSAAILLSFGQTAAFAQVSVPTAPSVPSPAKAPNPAITLNPAPPPPLTATAPITLPNYQEPTGPLLTVDQAVESVIENNTQVQTSRLQLKRVKYEVQQVTGEAYPQLSFSASDTYSNRDTSPGGVTSASSTVNSSGLNIPTIVDDQSNASGAASNNVSTAQTASTTTSSTSGAGSSTTSSTVTLVPVTGAAESSGTTSSGSTASEGLKPDATTGSSTTTTNPILQNFTATPYRINNYGGRISLSQLVDIDGLVSTSERLLKNEVTFYTIDLNRMENELAYSTKSQFFAVLRAEQQLTTDQEQVTNYQAELTDAQNRYEAGTAPAFDVVSAQTQLSSAQQALIDAEITLDVQRATLNNLMNRPIDTPFTTVTPNIPALPTDNTDATELAIAKANRPELLESVITLEIAKKLVKLDGAGLLPQMALSAALVYNGYASFPDGLGTSSSVTAAITLPLYDGGQTKALVNEAKTDVQVQQQTSDQLEESVALEVRSAFVNVRDSSALVAANSQGVAEARESLRLANIRYKAGTGTLLEVTNAEANLAIAETNLATAQFQLQTEYASLLRSEGLR